VDRDKRFGWEEVTGYQSGTFANLYKKLQLYISLGLHSLHVIAQISIVMRGFAGETLRSKEILEQPVGNEDLSFAFNTARRSNRQENEPLSFDACDKQQLRQISYTRPSTPLSNNRTIGGVDHIYLLIPH
jgi:hypothetical protein